MEERWFQIGGGKPVAEGDMTLLTAQLLAARLRQFGAKVSLVRSSAEPSTAERPEDLRKAAADELKRQGLLFIRDRYNGPADPLKQNSIQWESQLLFYRVGEIRKRAEIVNERLRPDVTLCLHYNAEPWGDPMNPQLTEKNHLHILLNGSYTPAELACDDVRQAMLLRLLERCFDEEIALAPEVAGALAGASGLPPSHTTANARQLAPYIWTRNLLASRLYRSPVRLYRGIRHEQQAAFFERIQIGRLRGSARVGGASRKSVLPRVCGRGGRGLAAYYRKARSPK